MSPHPYFRAAGKLRDTMCALLQREASLRAARFGVERRSFLTGSMGLLAASSVWQQIGRFSSPAEAQADYQPPAEHCYAALRETSTPDPAAILAAARIQHTALPETIMNMLRALQHAHAGFGVTMQTHALQTATRAQRAGANDELILIAVIHDIGDILSTSNHAQIAAALVRPYVSDNGYRLLRSHMEFQLKHYGEKVLLPTDLRERYAAEPWYADAERFSDEWDSRAFDPEYDTLPLEAFAPLVERVFAGAGRGVEEDGCG